MLMLSSSMSERSNGVFVVGTLMNTTETTSKPSAGRQFRSTARRAAITFQILMSTLLPQKSLVVVTSINDFLRRILRTLYMKVSSLLRSTTSSKLARRLSSRTARILFLVAMLLSAILLGGYSQFWVRPRRDTTGFGQDDLIQERPVFSSLWLQATQVIGTLTRSPFSPSTPEPSSYSWMSILQPISRALNSIKCAMGLGSTPPKEDLQCSWINPLC